MAFTYGFYSYDKNDSSSDAKLYDAEQVSNLFDGLITEGVYEHFGNRFRVTGSNSPDTVNVDSGRAWFNHTWNYNDNMISFPALAPTDLSSQKRIDALVIDINNETRHNELKWVEGTVTTGTPVKPTLTNTEKHVQKALAYITRSTSYYISNDMIENVVGTDETPFVAGVLKKDIVLSRVLTAGSTSVTFTGVVVGPDTVVNIGTSDPNADYASFTVSGTTYTVTFDEMENDVTVYLIISEVR